MQTVYNHHHFMRSARHFAPSS